MPETKKTAVLLLAYGGPDSLADIPEYLADIRGGRETPQRLIDEITDRYAQIGGRSPLLEITRSTADKLGQQLGLPVYIGMRHWTPYIKDTVTRMAADGIEHAVAICMAPHYSAMSIGAYRKKLDAALEETGAAFTVDFVEHWYTQPAYLAGIVNNTHNALDRFAPEERASVHVVFTAHSLPAVILERGDPYDAQLRETAEMLASTLGLTDDRWTFSYQSAAKTGMPWLGPQIEDHLAALAAAGEKQLLIVPIGFIAEHVEVLYDLDIGVQEIARQHGIKMKRAQMLNDSEPLISALAALVRDRFA